MCKCTPNIRTPFCGESECQWPEGSFKKDPKSVKIIQIATSSDGRVIAVGDNGKAYWYWSTHDARIGMILEHGWCEYPELPEVAPKNRGEKLLTPDHE